MSTLINTRERTRLAYEQLRKVGEEPTTRRIRQLIGTGSLSTISNELAEIIKKEASARTPVEPVSEPPASFPQETIRGLFQELRNLAQVVTLVSQELTNIRTELNAQRMSSAEQLQLAYSRFEAVQHISLQQVDIARQETRAIKDQLALVTKDFDVQEMALRGRAQQLREESQLLRGQLQAAEQQNAALLAKMRLD